MSNWDRVRRLAWEFHQQVCFHGSDKHPVGASAEVLLAKAEQTTGIRRKGYRKGHPQLRGALARFERNTILYDKSLEPWFALYNQAHEYGHICCGHGERQCTSEDIDGEATEDKLPLGVHRVEGYGPHERIECEANVFAREFLLPCDVLRRWFIENNLNAEQIAEKVGVSVELACHQLARALLLPDTAVTEEEEKPKDELSLDESQNRAAQAVEGPVLVAAGPGTGKTRTLVGRVLHLLRNNIPPESILILTFSNKAAGELRDRVRPVAVDQAQKIRIETFHSFGLELLRKYGTKIGLPAKPIILDPVDALFILESALPKLDLDHYENLYEPTRYLNDILKAISRAKDENAGPDRYQECAEKMYAAATTTEERVAAGKALEVAQVYKFYQQYLLDNDLLDFGDLLCRSVNLLQKYPTVKKEVRQTYKQVLVDEYQDVNRASGLLLREVVGEGKGLWAVGDIRQSIHRWRGATTANMRLFSRDFPKAKPPLSLEVNYRSQPPVVDAFSEFVPHMTATSGEKFAPWKKHRKHVDGTVKYEIADSIASEAQGIAREIERNVQAGISYRQQAIICRSHTSLARLAQHLEKAGIPLLYLGDLFERPEVRDLLSLLSLACHPDGRGLLRVARFPEYDIPLADVLTLRKLAKEKGTPFPQALQLASEDENISKRGKEKLFLLAQHLADLCHGKSAWNTLTRYLFVRSHYLVPLLADRTVSGQQRRFALYQLLQFVHSQLGRTTKKGTDPKKDLLSYIRRLEIYGEEKPLRQIPPWADGIDAVRVLTIHGSKGLEFKAVFLPSLAKTYLPINKGYNPCPLPTGLVMENFQDWHLEEEQCLFFVAMSRARDHLFLSRAKRYGKANRTPSDFLSLIESQLPRSVDGSPTWSDTGLDVTEGVTLARSTLLNELPVFELRKLEVYLKCPRQFFYEFELELGGKRDDSAYLQFHHCVYEVLRWMNSERVEGREPTKEEAQSRLNVIWQSKGPAGHFYESKYLEKAEKMIGNALRRQPSAKTRPVNADCEVQLTHGRVVFTLDSAEFSKDGADHSLSVRRHRTGRPTREEEVKPIYGLYSVAMQQAYPQAKRSLQIHYLSTDETKEVELTQKKIETRLQKYDAAIVGILQQNFDPLPDDRECPRCPHYFICPLGEDTMNGKKPGL